MNLERARGFFRKRSLMWWLFALSIIYIAISFVVRPEATLRAINEGLERASRTPIVVVTK